jgi:tetratricopeptide (TPR) repeat protein
MKMDHPTIEDFKGFLRSAPGPESTTRNARVLRHLLAECASCRDQLQDMGWGERRLESLVRFPVDWENDRVAETVASDYGRAFAATERALDAFFAEGKAAESTPEGLLAELAPLSQDEQVRRITAYSRFANPQLVQKLVEMSDAVRYESTSRMLHLADLARLAAEACTTPLVGSAPKRADLLALGWRQYANALRVSGRMREAEEAFAKAQRFCEEGTGDPPLRATLLTRLGSLRYFQRRFDEAIALDDEAIRIYSELSEDRSVAPIMVHKAIAQIYAGEPAAAVRTLNRAVPLIDNEGDPHLLLGACMNLIVAYLAMGEPEHALSLYFEARGLFQDFQDPLVALRAAWQEGLLLRDLGHVRAAEGALLRAREGFQERELHYEVAAISLDLSEVYLRLGEIGKLQEAVEQMVPIFQSLEVGREMLAALLQLQKADQQGRQAFELIRFLRSRLEQLPQRQPLK